MGASKPENRLEIQLLGRFSVGAGGVTVPGERWRLRKAQRLVQLLALAPAHRLHKEQILDRLWPEANLKAAANLFYQTLHAARKALDPSGELAQRYLALHNEQLSLCPDDPLVVDAEQFLARAAQAREQADPAAYAQALSLYTGDLLPDEPYEAWVQAPREALRQERLRLLVELAGLHESRGDLGAAIGALQQAVAADALHEEAHTGLMRLYAVSGQRQQALRQYQALKDALRRELEAEPDAAAARLYEEILAGRVAPAEPTAQPGAGPAPPRKRAARHNLPSHPGLFIGREKEVRQVSRLLATTRLVTLTGPGGVGKTRLGIQTAANQVEAYADGVWLVELGELNNPDLVQTTTASVFNLSESQGGSFLVSLEDYLREKRCLLVLDNCEHLVEACARLAEALLLAAPGLHILATSRELLGCAGEQAYPVQPLRLPNPEQDRTLEQIAACEAVQLFVESARKAHPAFLLTAQNAPHVAQICRRLDGIPLALELAAARADLLAPEQIAARLDDRFHLLTGSRRTALSRHQTLQASIDWSYDLLSAEEKLLLQRLAVFSGGWTLDAAEAICEDPDVLDPLTYLARKSLVIVDYPAGGTAPAGAATRYRMLETIRQYALERLFEDPEITLLRDRHLAYYLDLVEKIEVEEIEQETDTGDWFELRDRLKPELANLRAALSWSLGSAERAPGGPGRELDGAADPEVRRRARRQKGLRLAGILSEFWEWNSLWGEGLAWMVRNLGLRPGDETSRGALGAWMYLVGGEVAFSQNQMIEGTRMLEESVEIYRSLGDREGLGRALITLGSLQSHYDHRQAGPHLDEGLALLRAAGRKRAVARALNFRGWLSYQQRDFKGSNDCYQEALSIALELGNQRASVFPLANLALNTLMLDDPAGAQTYIDRAMQVIHGQGESKLGWTTTNLLANIAYKQGNYPLMVRYVQETMQLCREMGFRIAIVMGLRQMGTAARRLGDAGQADGYFRQSLELARELGDRYGIYTALAGFAGAAALQNRPEQAARLLGAVEGLFAAFTKPVDPLDQEEIDDVAAGVRSALGTPAFEQAWAAGKTMGFEEVLELAEESYHGDTGAKSP